METEQYVQMARGTAKDSCSMYWEMYRDEVSEGPARDKYYRSPEKDAQISTICHRSRIQLVNFYISFFLAQIILMAPVHALLVK